MRRAYVFWLYVAFVLLTLLAVFALVIRRIQLDTEAEIITAQKVDAGARHFQEEMIRRYQVEAARRAWERQRIARIEQERPR